MGDKKTIHETIYVFSGYVQEWGIISYLYLWGV